MTYETIIEKIKEIPEPYLIELNSVVENFKIGLIQTDYKVKIDKSCIIPPKRQMKKTIENADFGFEAPSEIYNLDIDGDFIKSVREDSLQLL